MKKFILIRHGKAEMSGEDHLRKLDEDGIAQSHSMCEKLKLMVNKEVKIYSSPFKRAIDTIKPLAEAFGKEIIESDELKEYSLNFKIEDTDLDINDLGLKTNDI